MTSPGEPHAVDPVAADPLRAEFAAATARLGITVPADLEGGVLRGYRGLRAMTALLREVGPRPEGVGGG